MQKYSHTGTVETGTTCNSLLLTAGGGVGIQVSGGGTWTLALEATMDSPADSAATWIAIKYYDAVTGAASAGTTITAAGAGYVDLPGFNGIRLRQTAGAGTPVSRLSEVDDTL